MTFFWTGLAHVKQCVGGTGIPKVYKNVTCLLCIEFITGIVKLCVINRIHLFVSRASRAPYSREPGSGVGRCVCVCVGGGGAVAPGADLRGVPKCLDVCIAMRTGQ